jgi:hypothetical protein
MQKNNAVGCTNAVYIMILPVTLIIYCQMIGCKGILKWKECGRDHALIQNTIHHFLARTDKNHNIQDSQCTNTYSKTSIHRFSGGWKTKTIHTGTR